MAPLQSNGSDVRQLPPLQLAFPLPSSPDTRMHLHLTAHSQAFVLLVHTSSAIVASSTANLSSFVYALPNVSVLAASMYRESLHDTKLILPLIAASSGLATALDTIVHLE